MRTEIEYTGGGMARVSLLFRREGRDPEDLWIRSELERFPVPPKRTLEWERGGERFDVWQYGQCVIGELMYDIEKHQLLCDRIGELCADELAALAAGASGAEAGEGAGERGAAAALVSEAAKEFHGAAKIRWDADDRKSVAVDEPPLRARVLELVGRASAGS